MSTSEHIRIKDYQIHLPPLGEGAYGRVYRATYRGISDRAVKIFHSGAVDLSTMARELEKLSSVAEHHGIVTLHDFDVLTDPPYYAMGLHADPLPDGRWETRTLERLCGHVDLRESWRLLREIADSLAYLHRHHIIHCDVKPTNILLTDEVPYGVKICDFGQSRGDALEGFHPAGTPLYASPEQLRNPRNSADGKGFRWDVYSFGVVAYKLITGRLPRLHELVKSERTSFDPEATVAESSLDDTVAESVSLSAGGERLASLTEAEPEIEWPPDVNLTPDQKELIERCLSLDPEERFADMREVWVAMQQSDQQRVVRRARRLNALFASLLVIAIWATGFAFFQARRAHQASEEAMKTGEQAEELVSFIVTKLNREELSGPGLDELYEHIADNAETYLENLPKSRRSATLLRISANAASLRGRQALEQGDLDLALEKFRNAQEIRSQLAESNPDLPELAWQASNDLIQIGAILEDQEKYDEAHEAYDKALTTSIGETDLDEPVPLLPLRRITRCLTLLAGTHQKNGDPGEAVDDLRRAVELHDVSGENASDDLRPILERDLLEVLKTLGAVQFSAGDLDDAGETWERVLQVADSLMLGESSFKQDAFDAYADGLRALGRIQLADERLEGAATFFRQEVPLRERAAQDRPYDPALRISQAEAYSNLAFCLDLEDRAERSLALFHLQQAASLLARLPEDLRSDVAIEEMVGEYRGRISEILEMDE